jgi:thymidylate synthase
MVKMNNIEHDYLKLLHDILTNGVTKQDRTGTGTRSVFGRQIRHDMSLGFPLLTTKKMPFKTIVTELLWFLRGDTNIKFLVDNNCHIWDGDAYKRYKNTNPDKLANDEMFEKEYRIDNKTFRYFTQEEFINKIKTDNEFSKKWGELGPIYGLQWRHWGEYEIDQFANLISDLKKNPDSRRLMVTAWNPDDLSEMVLPPCHYGFQCYVRDGKYLSLMWNQRSVDMPLGLPFNIASYALLLEMLARETNMIADQLIGNLGDCHIYLDQQDGVREQLTRSPMALGQLVVNDEFWNLNVSLFDQIEHIQPTDFRVENYQSHPAIKFPLSN